MTAKLPATGLLLVSLAGSGSGQSSASPGPTSAGSQTGSPCSYRGDHKVRVKLVVTADGVPTGVTVAATSGVACVDELAVKAAKQYRFPAKGVPVSLQLDVNFAAKDGDLRRP